MRANSLVLALVLFLLVFMLQSTVMSEENTPENDVESGDSSAVEKAMKEDMEKMKKIVQAQPRRLPDPEIRGVEFELGDNPVEGSDSARLIIVQISDYTCNHCAHHVNKTYPEIYKEYIATGKLRYTVIDYPHPRNIPAVKAARAARCAADQGKYWEMHDDIMADQSSIEDLDAMAGFVGLDMDEYKACMDSNKYNESVNNDILLAAKLEIPSVPGFIIGEVDPGNPKKVKGLYYIRGAKSFSYFQAEIERAMLNLP